MSAAAAGVMPPPLAPAFVWYAYDVAANAAATKFLSPMARGIHAALSDDAWCEPTGTCRVHGSRLTQHCRPWKLDAKAIWIELKDSRLWAQEGDDLVAVWLVPQRQRSAAKHAQRVSAAKRGVEQRAARKRRTTPRKSKQAKGLSDRSADGQRSLSDAGEKASDVHIVNETASRNALPDNDLSDRSADGQQRDVRSTSSLQEDVPRTAATTPSASHADGASGAVATDRHRPALEPRVVPDLRALLAEENIRASDPPIAWMDAGMPDLVDALLTANTGVDVERALYRACAAHQKQRGTDAHQPMVEELRASLAGVDGRGGLVGVGSDATRSLALALHGLAVIDHPPPPLVLRAVAGAIALELRAHGDHGDAKRMAVRVAMEFDRGTRKASGYALAGETTPAPRLLGYATRAETVTA